MHVLGSHCRVVPAAKVRVLISCRKVLASWFGAIGMTIAMATLPTAHAGVLTWDSVANFTESRSYGDLNVKWTIPLYSDGDSKTIGGIAGKVGAKASGSLSFGIEGILQTFWFPSLNLAYASSYKSAALWPGTLTVGDSFFLASSATPKGLTVLQLKDEGIKGWFALHETLAAGASATACLGGCVSLKLGLKGELLQKVVSLNDNAKGEVVILGKKVAGPPYAFSTPGHELTIFANIPNFSKTLKNVMPAGKLYDSQQNVLGAKVDIAQIFMDAAGAPFPLSGSLLGFEYTLLEFTAGLGIDIKHTLSMKVNAVNTYFTFSAPVQVFDGAAWGAPQTLLKLPSGDEAQVRPAQPTKTLGVTPTYHLGLHLDADWDAVPVLDASVRALEVSGHGLNFGPVFKAGLTVPLGSFDFYSKEQDWDLFANGKAQNLTFESIKVDPDGAPFDLCAGVGCLHTGFLPVSSERGDEWFTDTVYRVSNLTDECLRGNLDVCLVDPSFAPIRTDYRPSGRAGGGFDYAPDASELLRILGADDLAGGPESSEALVQDQLRRLGVDLDNLLPPRRIGDGAPPLTEPLPADFSAERLAAVPGPGGLLLVAIGLTGLGAYRVRRR